MAGIIQVRILLPLGALLVILLGGCCSGPKCWETQTGGDWPRTRATPIKLRYSKVKKKYVSPVINNSVSSPDKDRTDWRSLMLKQKGKLRAKLHWDKGKHNLRLTIYDAMGVKMMDGRPWGEGGRQALAAIEEPGRYYVRTQAKGEDDESSYTLRVSFEPETIITMTCDKCQVGDKQCVGEKFYVKCERIRKGCNRWPQVFSCATDGGCEKLSCGTKAPAPRPPPRKCRVGARRCIGARHVGVCKRAGKRTRWVRVATCRGKESCGGGKCKAAPAPMPKPSGKCVAGKIISMYKYRGRMNLHIRIGSGTGIRPGNSGFVYDGATTKKLPGGTIRVTRVSGDYCIATTQIERLGKNRRVCIKPK